MRIPIRSRALRDHMKDGEGRLQKRVPIVSKLAQLERERDRMSQQRANWQDQIDLIDARLTQISEVQKRLQRLLSHPDVVPPSVGEVAGDFGRPVAGQPAEPRKVTAPQH